MPESDSTFCQVIGRQLDRHFVTCKDLNVVLAHFAREVRQDLVSLAYLDFKSRVAFALDYSAIHRNHVFSWNKITSYMPKTVCYQTNMSESMAAWERTLRFGLPPACPSTLGLLNCSDARPEGFELGVGQFPRLCRPQCGKAAP